MRGLLQLQSQLRGRLIHATLSSQTNLVARCLIDLTPRWMQISTIHVVSEHVFWCNAIHSCNCYHIVLFFFPLFYQGIYVDKIMITTTMFIMFFARFVIHAQKTIFTAIRQIVKFVALINFTSIRYDICILYNDFSGIRIIMQSQKFHSYYTLFPRRPLSVITCISVKT